MNTVATFCLLFCASAYAYSAQVSNCSNEDVLIIPSDELSTVAAGLALDQPWENYFLPAPTAIALLGTILVLSGKTDFRLDERPRNFTYIRNPSSFRATMTQVANDGWDAFYLAHRNMDSISLNMGMIPCRIQTAVTVIEKSPASMFQRMLRVPLEGIQEINKLCVDLARATDNKFLEVMWMLDEVLEVTQVAGSIKDYRPRQTQNELTVAKINRANFSEQAVAEERDAIKRDADAVQTELSTIKEESVSNAQGDNHNQQPDHSIGSNERAKAPHKITEIKVGNETAASAHAMYQFHQRQANENFANKMQSFEAMGALTGRIASLDLTRIDTEENIKLIRECLGYLNDIRAQWAVLTHFFGAVAVRTEIMFNKTVTPFIKQVNVFGEQLENIDKDARAILLDILKPYIRSVQIAANYLHTLSKTYVTVSSNYILTQLAGVSGLSALPETQREVKIRELRNNNMVIQGQIVALVKEKTAQYNQTLTTGKKLKINGIIKSSCSLSSPLLDC